MKGKGTYRDKREKEKEKFDYKEAKDKALYYGGLTLATIALGTATYLVGRHLIRKSKTNREENKSMDNNSESSFAKRLYMAMDGLGTDVPSIRKVFVEIPDKATFRKVQKSYSDNFHTNLLTDLTDELTNTEFFEMQNILANKSEKKGQTKPNPVDAAYLFAKRLYLSMTYTIWGMPSTDEDGIKQTLIDIPSLYSFALTQLAYEKLYAEKLIEALDGDLGAFDFDWREIIKKKPAK